MVGARKFSIYLAWPLFTAAERKFNTTLAWALREHGYPVWLPQENEPRQGTPNIEQEIFNLDVHGIDESEVVIANMDGADADSGTAWEIGYAFAKGKKIITFRTDFRSSADCPAGYNIMLSESSTLRVTAVLCDAPKLAAKLREALATLE